MQLVFRYLMCLSLVLSTFGLNGDLGFVTARPFRQVDSHQVAQGADDWWDSQFSTPGTDSGVVYAVAVVGNEIFVGGQFTSIGKATANNVARWDGTRWSSLGDGADNGVNGAVWAITVTANGVYVGGDFTMAGSVVSKNVARWDGSSWTALDSGLGDAPGFVGSRVTALASDGSIVVAGGTFTAAGSTEANRIAIWNEATDAWTTLGYGLRPKNSAGTAAVYALEVTSDSIYAGGSFGLAGEVRASNVARWDRNGTTWSAIGKGTNGWVTALAVDVDYVYAGGLFTRAGSARANGIARWNGKAWKKLGKGLKGQPGARPAVNGLSVIGSDVYAAGGFTSAGGCPTAGMAAWNGTKWRTLGDLQRIQPDGTPLASGAAKLAAGSEALYVVGPFNLAGGEAAWGVAGYEYASGRWFGVVDSGPHNGILAYPFVETGGLVSYCRGNVYQVGEEFATGVVRWNGVRWELRNDEQHRVRGTVFAIAVSGTDTYIGGAFSGVGSVAASNVARWDGSQWSSLGTGIVPGGVVTSIAVDDSDVYVGGSFSRAGNVVVNNIARWDGTSWFALGEGNSNGIRGDSAVVNAIQAVSGHVYVGGNFSDAGNVAAANVAFWNGSQWSPLGSGESNGVSGSVLSLAKGHDGIYVGGVFDQAGGDPSQALAFWDGTSWSPVGPPLRGSEAEPPFVSALCVSEDGLYVGGSFTGAGDVSANHLAKWNGAAWTSFGSGLNGVVLSIGVSPGSVYVGGSFTTAGGKPSGICKMAARVKLCVPAARTDAISSRGERGADSAPCDTISGRSLRRRFVRVQSHSSSADISARARSHDLHSRSRPLPGGEVARDQGGSIQPGIRQTAVRLQAR